MKTNEFGEKTSKRMKPYGYLYTQGVMFNLLNPHPLPKDSQWNDGTYVFFVAMLRNVNVFFATHIVTNSFCLVYRNDIPEIEVNQIIDIEE